MNPVIEQTIVVVFVHLEEDGALRIKVRKYVEHGRFRGPVVALISRRDSGLLVRIFDCRCVMVWRLGAPPAGGGARLDDVLSHVDYERVAERRCAMLDLQAILLIVGIVLIVLRLVTDS